MLYNYVSERFVLCFSYFILLCSVCVKGMFLYVPCVFCVCNTYFVCVFRVCYVYVTCMLRICYAHVIDCSVCVIDCSPPPCVRPPPSHAGLDDVGVDLRHPVDGVGAHDAEVGHVHPLPPFLLDEGHPPQPVHVLREQGRHALETGAGGRERERQRGRPCKACMVERERERHTQRARENLCFHNVFSLQCMTT